MAQRRTLTDGLTVVPPGTDPDAVKDFITQRPETKRPIQSNSTPAPVQGSGGIEIETSRLVKTRRTKKVTLPIGRIPVTVRLKPEIAAALKRASLERQLEGEEVYTQQDLVELVLEPWLKGSGYFA